tara:strand:- start:2004 stop:2387 length:384 start_codon:yes stop_codon:yes gene_type:complete
MEVSIAEFQVKAHEDYLGELLGKYLEAKTAVMVLKAQNQQYEEALAGFESAKEQIKDVQKQLQAMKSNKDAFEEQNTTLSEDCQTLKSDLANLKTALQMERENSLMWKEKCEALQAKKRPRGRPRKK